MAFENLLPHKEEILQLRKSPNRKTLVQIAQHLHDTKKINTTPGTISRFLKSIQGIGWSPRSDTSSRNAD